MEGRIRGAFIFIFLASLLVPGCSFDYGEGSGEDSGLPDLVMNDVEYVRVKDGDPQVKFRAEQAERYEDRQLMELRNFSFEQFSNHGGEIDSAGRAAAARVELDSGNIGISGGVSLSVDSEDITIETESLDWQDSERQLSGNPEAPVRILRDDGTSFQGWGFKANTRSRAWEFAGPVGGSYVHEDDEEDGGGEAEPGGEENSEFSGEAGNEPAS
ncbi:MAG: LPS export ABC transporter periplasmic protein LptC [Treponema sp.]|jgi:LPS export ABC transporter protein LptC|nr:LPS export ABC transporter periplasmic protein LptC [Treponema sp.]